MNPFESILNLISPTRRYQNRIIPSVLSSSLIKVPLDSVANDFARPVTYAYMRDAEYETQKEFIRTLAVHTDLLKLTEDGGRLFIETTDAGRAFLGLEPEPEYLPRSPIEDMTGEDWHWTTARGKRLHMTAMTTDHIMNTIYYLERKFSRRNHMGENLMRKYDNLRALAARNGLIGFGSR